MYIDICKNLLSNKEKCRMNTSLVGEYLLPLLAKFEFSAFPSH